MRGPETYRSNPPVIAFNGDKFVIAYDYGTPANVGVLTLDGATNPIDDVVLGSGSRPSITWTGDRWILRAEGSVLMYAAPSSRITASTRRSMPTKKTSIAVAKTAHLSVSFPSQSTRSAIARDRCARCSEPA